MARITSPLPPYRHPRQLVIGSIRVEELQKAISHLRPDEVGPGDPEHLPPALSGPERRTALVAWWDRCQQSQDASSDRCDLSRSRRARGWNRGPAYR